jgi:hypothetical protein
MTGTRRNVIPFCCYLCLVWELTRQPDERTSRALDDRDPRVSQSWERSTSGRSVRSWEGFLLLNQASPKFPRLRAGWYSRFPHFSEALSMISAPWEGSV